MLINHQPKAKSTGNKKQAQAVEGKSGAGG